MEEFKKNALDTCREFLGGPWKDLKLENFHLTKISGGLSNKLYLCSSNDHWHDVEEIPREVLLRVRGPIEISLETAIQVAALNTLLAEKNLGPKIYGFFDEGRLEEYVPSISLNSVKVVEMSLHIAREMAKIHALQIPMRKNPRKLHNYFVQWMGDIEDNVHMIPDGPDMNKIVKKMVTDGELRREFEWVTELIEKLDSPSVVFCHNDIHGGNVLLRKDVPQGSNICPILIIDFEFSCYHYRSFEIAAQFCGRCFDVGTKEYPYYELDFERYPSREEQESILDAYLEQLCKEVALLEDFNAEQEKEKILKEVEIFRIYFCLTPALWAFKMIVSPGYERFDLGFVEFGLSFIEFYQKFKAEYHRENQKTSNSHNKN